MSLLRSSIEREMIWISLHVKEAISGRAHERVECIKGAVAHSTYKSITSLHLVLGSRARMMTAFILTYVI